MWVRTEIFSINYVYLEVTKGHNSILNWCSATKLGVSHPHVHIHFPVKWQYNLKTHYKDMGPDGNFLYQLCIFGSNKGP